MPSIIGIGAQRSGTTWIYEMLKAHPEVCMSPEKEVNFFNYHFHNGIRWYEKFFDGCDKNKKTGEYSPTYLSDDQVPERICQTVPDARLIISLRNPVDQIYSRYLYRVSRQGYDGSFADALKEDPSLIENAFYYKHIKKFLNRFDRNQILILIYEDLIDDALGFVQRIYRFLNIDINFVPANLNEKIHVSRIPKSRSAEYLMVFARGLFRQFRLFSVVEKIKEKGVDTWFKQLNTKDVIIARKIDPGLRCDLNNTFFEDIQKISTLLGRDLSFWK